MSRARFEKKTDLIGIVREAKASQLAELHLNRSNGAAELRVSVDDRPLSL